MFRSFCAIVASLVMFSLPALGADANADQRELLQLMRKLTSALQTKPGEVVSPVSVSGRFVFNITVNVKSTVSDPISCEADVNHSGTNNYYSQFREVAAARSGSTATCKIIMNYSWPHANSANAVSIRISVSTQTCTCPFQLYEVNHDLPDIALPSGGTTTISYQLDI